MAKCIRVVGQGVPTRMSDDDAHTIVAIDHDGEYCSKRFFKDWYRPAAEGQTYNPSVTKLEHGKIVKASTLHFNAQHKREKVSA